MRSLRPSAGAPATPSAVTRSRCRATAQVGLVGPRRDRDIGCWSSVPFPTSPQEYSGGEMRKTNPISLAPGGHRRRIVQNEPNLAPPQVGDGGDCAKRTQFPWPRAGTGGESCKTNPIWPYRRWVTGEIARNEPNFARPRACAGGQMCKTNPIGPHRRWVTGEIVQNEPNFARPRACAGGQMCKTNPICPGCGPARVQFEGVCIDDGGLAIDDGNGGFWRGITPQNGSSCSVGG
jgi:hypothetical protein